MSSISCLETNYNNSVQILLGKNALQCIFDNLQDQFGTKSLQDNHLRMSWYIMFRLVLREKALQKNNRIGIVKLVHHNPVTVRPSVTL